MTPAKKASTSTDRTYLKVAAQKKALAAWEKDGRQGERPATPDLDAYDKAKGETPRSQRERTTPKAERSDLPEKILGYLRRHRDEADGFSPSAIGKAIGRSSGAVTYALGYLVKDGKVTQTSDKPKRFAATAAKRRTKAA